MVELYIHRKCTIYIKKVVSLMFVGHKRCRINDTNLYLMSDTSWKENGFLIQPASAEMQSDSSIESLIHVYPPLPESCIESPD